MRIVLLLLCCCLPVFGEGFSGVVIDVHDGDTVTVQEKDGGTIHKVRLEHIDAPELKQDLGKESQLYLSKRVKGQVVEVEVSTKDKYSREVGEVYYRGESINLRQVMGGYAWHYKGYSKEVRFAKAETFSREQKRGLWNTKDPIAPWDFRKKK